MPNIKERFEKIDSTYPKDKRHERAEAFRQLREECGKAGHIPAPGSSTCANCGANMGHGPLDTPEVPTTPTIKERHEKILADASERCLAGNEEAMTILNEDLRLLRIDCAAAGHVQKEVQPGIFFCTNCSLHLPMGESP